MLQPEDGEYGDGFDEVTAMAAGRLGWATTRLPGGSFMAHTHPEVLRDALVTLLSSCRSNRSLTAIRWPTARDARRRENVTTNR